MSRILWEAQQRAIENVIKNCIDELRKPGVAGLLQKGVTTPAPDIAKLATQAEAARQAQLKHAEEIYWIFVRINAEGSAIPPDIERTALEQMQPYLEVARERRLQEELLAERLKNETIT